MTPLYISVGVLVVAQALGIYGLISHKADFTLALVLVVLVAVALAAGVVGFRNSV